MSNCCRLTLLACVCICFAPRLLAAQEFVQEKGRRTPVLYDVDVVVVGGGLSGVGAAIGAARAGARTLVIERTGYLGGWIRSAGLGNTVAIKGWRPAVSEGVLLDVAKRMIEMKAEGYPDLNTVIEGGQLRVTNYETLPVAFQSLVVESKAEILYFSTYTDSVVNKGKIEAVIVETPVGRIAVRGKVFIDCTGLATVAAESGAPVRTEEAFMGLASWISGVDKQRFDAFEKKRPKEGSPELRKWMENWMAQFVTKHSTPSRPDKGLELIVKDDMDVWWERNSGVFGDFYREAVDKGELPLLSRVGKSGIVSIIEGVKVDQFEISGGIARPRTHIVGVDPTNAQEVSEAHVASTQLLFKYIQFLNKYIPGFERAQITRMADTTLNRAGRYLHTEFSPTSPQINKPFKSEDTICVLQRGVDAGLYEVPYRTLLPKKIDNLLAVGKSSSGGMRFRTHMLSMIMGQAAGTAAAISIEDNILPRNISIKKLQAELRNAGIKIP